MLIIGAGRVGGALAQRAETRGQTCHLLTRTEGWSAIERTDAPIFVAVRNDDLDAVVERVPAAHRQRLVFTQNGMLRNWLDSKGLQDATRGLLFFAVASRGAALDPGGESPFIGPHAAAVSTWLGQQDVPATETSASAFATTELEKLIWNCAFGLLCEVTGGPVGAVVEDHPAQLRELVLELIAVGQSSFDLKLSDADQAAMLSRLRTYSLSIPTYRGAVKEWPWRNGWFVQQANSPGCHERLLEQTGHLKSVV